MGGFLFVATCFELVHFYFARSSQMKPSGDEAMAKWNEARTGWFWADGLPPNHLWNTFIGCTRTFADLPALAPTYDVSVRLCGSRIYHEVAADRGSIPRCCRLAASIEANNLYSQPDRDKNAERM